MSKARLRSRWQKIWQRRVTIAITTAIVIVIVEIIVCTLLNGTGFSGYTLVSTISTLNGPAAGIVTRTVTNEPGKTLWDWLGLLGVLAIPVAVALGTAWFTKRQNQTQLQIAEKHQQDAALQAFIDKISELLLRDKRSQSKPQTDPIWLVARAQTMMLLRMLDGVRKGWVIHFLHESELLGTDKDKPIILLATDNSANNALKTDLCDMNLSGSYLGYIDLSATNLSNSNFSGAYLHGANLLETELSNCNLSDAILTKADLSFAILDGANLSRANLDGANLTGITGISIEELEKQAKSLKGATMPDMSVHS